MYRPLNTSIVATLLGVAVIAAVAGCDRKPTGSPAGAAGRAPATRPATKPAAIPPEQVEAKVREIVAEQMGVAVLEVTRGIRLTEDLKADDLDRVELVMELEDVFSLTISDEDEAKLRTVGQLVDYVRSRQSR